MRDPKEMSAEELAFTVRDCAEAIGAQATMLAAGLPHSIHRYLAEAEAAQAEMDRRERARVEERIARNDAFERARRAALAAQGGL